MEIPNKLKIEDGRIKMIDGSSLRAYLKKFQKNQNIEDGRCVNISDHKQLKRDIEDAVLMRGWGC